LAQAIAAASETLVNDLSARSRRDTMRHAEEEATATEKRLKSALARLRDFRDKEGTIDPDKTAAAVLTLATKVRDELEQAKSQRATLKTYMREDAPSLKVLDARIRSLETQLRAVSGEVTASDPNRTALSRLMGSYEELESDRRFAEAAYQHALEALDRARSDADRQQVYVASFVPPGLPEEALHPRRLRSFGVIALLAFALWGIGCLAVQSVRDHL
jgi:capsular polysaccharide transport system permease protein